jgi:hypothetical protein
VQIEEIDVYIDADGQVKIEVRCVQGMACQDITAPLEAALGGDIVARELTPEAYAQVEGEDRIDERLRRES